MNFQGPHIHILMMAGKGGESPEGGPSDFLGLKFWPKVIFFGSMKDTGIFLCHEKKSRGILGGCQNKTKGFFWVC